jgi:transcriptional regulator with XRE-family HTH domain
VKIRELRKQLGLSQERLAALIGVKQSSVSSWESGESEPTMKNIRKLANVLCCTVAELLGEG